MQTKVQASSEGDPIGSNVSCMLAILPPGGRGSLPRQEMWEVWRSIFIRVWAGIRQFEDQSPSPVGRHSTITTQGPKDEDTAADTQSQ